MIGNFFKLFPKPVLAAVQWGVLAVLLFFGAAVISGGEASDVTAINPLFWLAVLLVTYVVGHAVSLTLPKISAYHMACAFNSSLSVSKEEAAFLLRARTTVEKALAKLGLSVRQAQVFMTRSSIIASGAFVIKEDGTIDASEATFESIESTAPSSFDVLSDGNLYVCLLPKQAMEMTDDALLAAIMQAAVLDSLINPERFSRLYNLRVSLSGVVSLATASASFALAFSGGDLFAKVMESSHSPLLKWMTTFEMAVQASYILYFVSFYIGYSAKRGVSFLFDRLLHQCVILYADRKVARVLGQDRAAEMIETSHDVPHDIYEDEYVPTWALKISNVLTYNPSRKFRKRMVRLGLK